MRLKTKLTFIFLICCTFAFSQDVQLSQYYNSPLYLNPAFAGTGNNTRAIVNYRSQWTALPSPFVTTMASFDHFAAPINSGIGLLVQRDRQGDGRLNSTSASLLYSYHVWVSEKLTFIPALQVGFTNRSINYGDFIFGDQLSSGGATGLSTTDSYINNSPNKNFMDISSGGLLYSDKFWIGISSHHINKPNEAFTGTSPLPVMTSIHGGYKINLQKLPKVPKKYLGDIKERSITPTFLYKTQGNYDQFDLGLYATLEPVVFGMWYRGIPIKKYKEGINNHESLVFMAGVRFMGFAFAYSYDLTISTFKPGSGGAHEISLIYQWEVLYKNFKPKKHPRKVSCPTFYR